MLGVSESPRLAPVITHLVEYWSQLTNQSALYAIHIFEREKNDLNSPLAQPEVLAQTAIRFARLPYVRNQTIDLSTEHIDRWMMTSAAATYMSKFGNVHNV